jgi:hypothetical protein
MKEIWKPVNGYEGKYAVSSEGRIKSLPYVCEGRWGKAHMKGKVLQPVTNTHNGYCYICLVGDKRKKTTCRYHRIVAEAFIPNPDNKPCVNHIDGDKHNNHPSNLAWVTHSENTTHAYDSGLMNVPRGSQCSHSKLTESCVKFIRANCAEGKMSMTDMAKDFDVSISTIGDVVHGRTWKHV